MVVKTITVTKNACEAIKVTNGNNESFSETLLRITKRKPLSAFFGVLSDETGKRMEKAIAEARALLNKSYGRCVQRIDMKFVR